MFVPFTGEPSSVQLSTSQPFAVSGFAVKVTLPLCVT